MTLPDTIVAIASPAGRGAVGLIRVSGPEVPIIATALLGTLPTPRFAQLAKFKDRDGETLDYGLALYFPAPASFTGEHVLELQGHGGVVVLDSLLHRVLELGARLARAGEFSERAFLNGKMDVAQAEAVADLIDAGSTAAARAAARSMQGEFSARIETLRSQLTELRAYVEAAIDFPDEDIDFLQGNALRGRLSEIFTAFESIQAAANQGALLREGLTVVIAGKPNAGKSSLLNRLVGDDVAIVTDIPGTTRDPLRHSVHIDGLPITLIDTAGLRQATDAVEAEGVRRARVEISRADHLLYVLDASEDEAQFDPATQELWRESALPTTFLVNKIDLVGRPAEVQQHGNTTHIYLSALTGSGLELLKDHLKRGAGYHGEAGALSARRRHLDALSRAHVLVKNSAVTLAATRALELFAEDLRLAQQVLGEITGEFTSDDLLGEIFGSFCIGK